VIFPRRLDQASFKANAGQAGTPVGIVLPEDWGNAKLNGGNLASLEVATAGFVNVAGYNSFMFLGTMDVGSTGFTIKVGTPDYADNITPFGILFNDTVSAFVPPSGRVTFSAPSGARPNDVWGWIQVSITGTAPLGATNCKLTMLCAYR